MNTKHTPGPWVIVGGNSEEATIVCKPGDGIVTHIARLHDQWICDEHGGSAFENARRIVACVNACEGISTEALEGWEALHLMNVAHLRQQRDELLLAAQRAFIELEYAHEKLGNDRKLTRQDVLRDARAAIANVKGGA